MISQKGIDRVETAYVKDGLHLPEATPDCSVGTRTILGRSVSDKIDNGCTIAYLGAHRPTIEHLLISFPVNPLVHFDPSTNHLISESISSNIRYRKRYTFISRTLIYL